MNLQTRKLNLIENLLLLQNEKALQEIENLLNSFKNKHIASELMPMSLDEFYSRNSKSQKEIAEGKLVSQQDVKKHFERKKK
jgi:hypothetical protein